MTQLFTRKTSFALVFGLFFIVSCSSLSKSESPNQSSSNTGPLTEIETINKQIEENGSSESLLLRKAQLFIEAAQNETLPSSRKTLYTNARNTSVDGAYQFSDKTAEFNQILAEAWSFEHNTGVRLLHANSDDSGSQDSFERAVSHLEYAITLQPDSLQSYNILATAYYSNGLYTDADNVLIQILEINTDPEKRRSVKEKQAFIYLESGNTNKAVSIYEDLFEENNSSITITHGLINAYILDNQHVNAALLLQDLKEQYPDQFSYKESLASVKYEQFRLAADSLLTGSNSSVDLETKVEDLISQLDLIKNIYEDLSENSLLGEERIHTVAGFHTNGASYLEDIREKVGPNTSAFEKLTESKNELLNLSLKYWEQLADINPDNVEYLYTLYTVYNKLEMFEKAENIEQSFNF
jgi:tetratricopeptide (TPR) repeat protein